MPDNAVELNKTKNPNKFQVRADLHVHTTFSKDSMITPKRPRLLFQEARVERSRRN